MEARMKHPAVSNPAAMKALQSLAAAYHDKGISTGLIELVQLRVSQINGCSACVDGHSKMLRKEGETDERLFGVAAWRESIQFTDAERAALGLAECMTRLADQPDAVPDAVWDDAADHFTEDELSALILAVSSINVWNRINATIRQPAVGW